MANRSPTPTSVQQDEWGFFLSADLWSEELAPGLAVQCGIPKLTERHWQVIRFARAHYLESGTKPTVRLLGHASGVPARELYELFPNSPALAVARIAGIPKMYLCHNCGPNRAVPAIPRRGRTPKPARSRWSASRSLRETVAGEAFTTTR